MCTPQTCSFLVYSTRRFSIFIGLDVFLAFGVDVRLLSYLQVLKVKPLSDQQVYDKLLSSVNYSLKTDGYRWTFWKNAGGWMEVLKRYPIEKKRKFLTWLK